MNAINSIYPYKHKGQWVFDDESKELDKEPFVAGADTLIDMLSDNADKCVLIFAKDNFPDATEKIKKVGAGMGGGTNYVHAGSGHQLWLCPALLKYFNTPPEEIYFKVKLYED